MARQAAEAMLLPGSDKFASGERDLLPLSAKTSDARRRRALNRQKRVRPLRLAKEFFSQRDVALRVYGLVVVHVAHF